MLPFWRRNSRPPIACVTVSHPAVIERVSWTVWPATSDVRKDVLGPVMITVPGSIGLPPFAGRTCTTVAIVFTVAVSGSGTPERTTSVPDESASVVDPNRGV